MTEKTQEKLSDIIETISNFLAAENLPLGLPQKHSALVAKVKETYLELREIYVAETGEEDHWRVYDGHLGIKQ